MKAGRKVYGTGFRRDAEDDMPEACAPLKRHVMECAGRAGSATALSDGRELFGWAEDLRAFQKRCRAALAPAVQNACAAEAKARRGTGGKGRNVAKRQ